MGVNNNISSNSGKVSSKSSESEGIMSHEPLEVKRDNCVVTVLGLKLQPGGLPSQELRDRCALGAKIAKEENAMKVIPTGGDPEKRGVTEAEAMGKFLLELGVEEEKLLLEMEADDTTTNAYNVLKLIQNELLVHQVFWFNVISVQSKNITGEGSLDNSDL